MNAFLAEQAILLVAAWTSGISLYLTVLVLGVSQRAGWLDLPGGLETLGHPLIIAFAAILYAIEFVADKVPYVDSAWDSVHTVVRPAGAAAVGYLAGTEHGPLAQTAFALFAGTFALDAHALKASSRLAINTSPEPFSNVAASVAEDALVLALFWFAIKHPVWAALVVILLAVGSFFLIRLLWRFVVAVFRRLFGRGGGAPARPA